MPPSDRKPPPPDDSLEANDPKPAPKSYTIDPPGSISSVDESPVNVAGAAAPVVVEVAKAEAEHPLFSPEELAEIRTAAKSQFDKDRKAAARAQLIQQEMARLERQHGRRMLGGGLDDMVTIKLLLPDTGGGGTKGPFHGIIIDQEIFQEGQEITRPRHVINSILETIWRGQIAEHSLSGKKREEFYRMSRPVEVRKEDFHVLEGVDVGAQETVRVA